ncbi:hypothetical protein BASA62_007367 [Batrachochytrium salamandrivorans]|nr:hypothetical protein BASA62_007367 [Batrachochytrium salamandrivorans]
MKFNALVVAAMVITSVNAGLWRSTMGCFGHSCRLRSASSQGSLDSDSDESQESEAQNKPNLSCYRHAIIRFMERYGYS